MAAASPPAWMLDATFGRGGHCQAVLECCPDISIAAMDVDKTALEWGKKHLRSQNIYWAHASFHHFPAGLTKCFPRLACPSQFDMIIMDLGVSSPQLDQAERGFSFYHDGPLDMRMDQTQSFSAGDIVNGWNAKDLHHLFKSYGEIFRPGKVINALLRERKKQKITRTGQLSRLIEKHTRWKTPHRHPAAPYFLALRMKVNNELDGLKSAWPALIHALKPGGRLFVLTFHSLEDRIVKQAFLDSRALSSEAAFKQNKKVIRCTQDEIKQNPRARSAKLRVFEKASPGGSSQNGLRGKG